MEKVLKFLIITFVGLILLSCGLERSNPLDPAGSDIDIPGLVTGINLSSSGQGAVEKFVIISWTPLQDNEADGYFIYRSRSYEGTYDLISVIRNREENSFTDTFKITSGAFFYKMSAFVYLNPLSPNDNERLEGPLNRPGEPGIMVPQ